MKGAPQPESPNLPTKTPMAHVSHKFSGPLSGALAGGGDPATSPLYVFGPFLRLIVGAGVASVTFGASIWLAVLTVVTVSAMYRQVMRWVTDGSGGSGLSEEEFGPWAVKLNAAITVIEYTLTFLVSMAALVTFLADRVPALAQRFLGVPLRTLVAIALSVAVGVAVNRGPKVAARAFGPATAAVLLLLWAMILTTVYKFGLRLPALRFEAFSAPYVGFTLGGYAHILALMTGIEIFANLVAAYEGNARERSRKAFGSLLIVMGTTSLTMLVVGPAIYALANPLDASVSVFTQTMDKLFSPPVAYLGTLVGVAVLLSAAAASAQGIQNLALGLRYRHYIPATFGQRNRFDVADRPVWVEITICLACFLLFGTQEETYLALYAAGVFVLLSLTGWAAVKRLSRQLRSAPGARPTLSLLATAIAALMASGATVIIFEDRFREGAWAYALLVPVLYATFGWHRKRLGSPSSVEDRVGLVISSSCLPLGVGSADAVHGFRNLLVPLDGSPTAECATALASFVAREYGAKLTLLSVAAEGKSEDAAEFSQYLRDLAEQLRSEAHETEPLVLRGDPSEQIGRIATSGTIDALVMTTVGRSAVQRLLTLSTTSQVIYQTTPPLFILRPTNSWRSIRTRFERLLVTLDGSETSEQVLPYARELAARFHSTVVLLSVPEGSESDDYLEKLRLYLSRIQDALRSSGISSSVLCEGSGPAESILRHAESERVDLIMMVSHGRGGVARQNHVKLGSVVERVLQATPCPVFMVSATPSAPPKTNESDRS